MRLGKNVFQIWCENDGKMPFLVQKSSWANDSYFMVMHVEMSEEKLKYFDRTGSLYGRAFGFLYRRGQRITEGRPVELRNAGVYKWRRVHEEKMRPFWKS